MYTFPLRVHLEKEHKEYDSVRHIFPTKQKDVKEIIDIAKSIPGIIKVVVFGSAVTLKCGLGSDLDISIFTEDYVSSDDFSQIARRIYEKVTSEIDIVHYNTVRSQLLKNNIIKKGVCIYAKR